MLDTVRYPVVRIITGKDTISRLLPKMAIAIASASTLALTVNISSASAFQVFFGEDLNISGSNDNPPLNDFSNASQAEADFLSNLSGVGTEDFEDFSEGQTAPLTLTFPGAGTGTLSGSDYILGSTSSNGGVYPISGNKNWFFLRRSSGGNRIRLNFEQPATAFGFYLTDQESTQFNVQLGLANGDITNLVTPNSTSPEAGSGSVFYYGVIADAPSEVFTSVDITFTDGVFVLDGVGIDDITISSSKDVPEPLTILGSVTALGIGALLKREYSKKLKKG